jgi:hypothetical protein
MFCTNPFCTAHSPAPKTPLANAAAFYYNRYVGLLPNRRISGYFWNFFRARSGLANRPAVAFAHCTRAGPVFRLRGALFGPACIHTIYID